MSATSPFSEGGDPDAFEGRHRMAPISLPLHEAIGLCLLFQAATPEQVQGLRADDVTYAFSAAYGYLRIREAIATLFSDQESLTNIAADRAQLDQAQAGWGT